MRILMVNWAKVWDAARIGGGANGYMNGLARELAKRGHDVSCLATGIEDVPDVNPLDFRPTAGPISIRRHDDWNGIRVFEVVNSPVLAPAVFNFQHPELEERCPQLAAEVGRFVHLLQPDVVHLHNIEGLSADCVDAIVSDGSRVVFSLHNYHSICPQVYLMQCGLTPCHDFEGGAACERCAATVGEEFDSRHEHLRRWTGAMKRLNVPITKPLMPTVDGRLPLPFHAVEAAEDVIKACPFPVEEVRGRPPIAAAVGGKPEEPKADLAAITNEINADSRPDLTNKFGRRRAAMLAMLNRCDAVHAVSEYVAQRFQRLGVRPSIVHTFNIGTRASEFVSRSRARVDGAVINLVFLGFHNRYKGLDVLLDAIELLDPAISSRFGLHVYAQNLESAMPRLDRLRSKISFLGTQDGYVFDSLPELLADKDVGVVPSIWWDNGPQTVMEFQGCGLPVIGADVGGIPDLVQHNVNGLLFRGNDREALATSLTQLVTDAELLPRLKAAVRRPKSMKEHASEMEGLYQQLCLPSAVAEGVAHVR